MTATGRARVTREIERKFDVDGDFTLPELAGLPGVVAVAGPREHALDATYFDSADLRLVRHRLTLRRRTGGDDAGWHLKRPRGDGERDEVHARLGRSPRKVPAELRAAVEVYLRGAEVVPVVRLQTRRRVSALTGHDGTVLVEIADDTVTATVLAFGGGQELVRTWREVEVELVDGPPQLLAAVGKRLVASGARPSGSPSKLARALADRPPVAGSVAEGVAEGAATASGPGGRSGAGGPVAAAAPRAAPKRGVSKRGTPSPGPSPSALSARGVPNPAGRARRPGRAGAVVLEHLGALVARLVAEDPRARVDAEDAVHQMRVATRKLRSCLVTFRPLFDGAVTDSLRDELAWLGAQLAGPRDAEVIRDHLLDDLARQPPEVVLGPVRSRVLDTLQQRHAQAHAHLLTQLSGTRYFALLDALDALLAAPPLTAAAAGRAHAVLLPLVERTWRRTDRLVRAAGRAPDAEHRDLLLHEVRKAAKRARYAGESLTTWYGRPARRFAARMKAVQEVLGDHQDSVVIRQEILRLVADAGQAGEPTFTYGRLHARQEQRGARTAAEFAPCWEKARRPSLRAWLR